MVLAVVTVVELVAGFVTNSLALLSDAGHMLTDVGGLGMALAAIHVADRSPPRATSAPTGSTGWRSWRRWPTPAAVRGGRLRLCEAVRRWGDAPEVLAGPMLVVAVLGLVANVVAFVLLREGPRRA